MVLKICGYFDVERGDFLLVLLESSGQFAKINGQITQGLAGRLLTFLFPKSKIYYGSEKVVKGQQ